MNKKGISTVIATVLIILLTVSAITLLGSTIVSFVKGTLLNTDCLDVQTAVRINNEKVFTNYEYRGDCTTPSATGVWQSACNTGFNPYDASNPNAQTKVNVRIERDANSPQLNRINILIDHNGNTVANKTVTATTTPPLPSENGKKVYEVIIGDDPDETVGYLDGRIQAKLITGVLEKKEPIDCQVSGKPTDIVAKP